MNGKGGQGGFVPGGRGDGEGFPGAATDVGDGRRIVDYGGEIIRTESDRRVGRGSWGGECENAADDGGGDEAAGADEACELHLGLLHLGLQSC